MIPTTAGGNTLPINPKSAPGTRRRATQLEGATPVSRRSFCLLSCSSAFLVLFCLAVVPCCQILLLLNCCCAYSFCTRLVARHATYPLPPHGVDYTLCLVLFALCCPRLRSCHVNGLSGATEPTHQFPSQLVCSHCFSARFLCFELSAN